MSGKYRLLLAFWGGLFVTSALIMFVSLRSFPAENGGLLPSFPIVPPDGTETETDKPPIDKPGAGDDLDDGNGRWTLALSAVSALISAAGFMATTYFALRNDRRQAALTELEVEKLIQEIERQRLEIERLRREKREQEQSRKG